MASVPALPEGQVESLAKVLGECGSGTDISRVLQARRQVESLAKVLGECGSGTDISRVLQACGLVDNSGESTKWRRLYAIFLDCQRTDRCANRVLDFVQAFLIPARFIGRSDEFEGRRCELNTILAFSGLE